MKGYRTAIFNTLSTVMPIMEASGLTDYLPEKFLVWYVLAMAAANIVLRFMTTTPIGKPE